MTDFRYAFRQLIKSPTFSVTAIFALALGIGANTAIFSVVNAVLLRPLPYAAPDQLVRIGGATRSGTIGTFSPPDFFDWRERNTVFESIAAYDGTSPSLTGGTEPERLNGAHVSPSFFSILRVAPALGRDFLPNEEQRGNHRIAVLSHDLWQRRFAADPQIVNHTIDLNGERFLVVGVMPRDFQPPQFAGSDAAPPDIWVPFAPDLTQWGRDGRSVDAAIGRLRPGKTLGEAAAEMHAIALQLQQQYPKTNAKTDVRIASLQEQLVGRTRPALLVFLAAVGLVLLIACANVANMLLARTAARQKEIAIRAALGAPRFRIVRQFLTESLLLAATGGIAGWLIALWATDLLPMISSGSLPRGENVRLDAFVLIFTALITIGTGILLGLAPALQMSHLRLNDKLKEGGRNAAGGATHRRAQSLLIVFEIAFSLILLVGAALLAKSFLHLQQINPGFDANDTLTMNVFLPGTRYPNPPQHSAFFERVIEKVAALPGVQHVGLTSNLPVSGNYDQLPLYIEGQPLPLAGEAPQTERYMVNADYFRAIGTPLLSGRNFGPQDNAGAIGVAIIGETTARQFFPNENPLGKRIKIGEPANPWLLVVGVAADVRHYALDRPASLQVYIPHLQSPSQAMTLIVRAKNPESQIAAVRNQIWAIDPNQPVYDVKTMQELLAKSIASRRLNMLLIGTFAGVALLLAMIGVYGVMSYAVAQRTHEIGVRMAVGAQYRDILKLVVGHGMFLIATGIAIGLGGAVALMRVINALLFDVAPSDPSSFLGMSLLLGAVAIAACYLPARRAAQVDPIEALRTE